MAHPIKPNAQDLFQRLCSYCFPGGEDKARQVRAVRTTQKGEMRSAPDARWIAFTAEEVFETWRSSFRWEARYAGGSKGLISVTDAYEEGHGRLVVKLGGIIPVKKAAGPEFDRGELQRYLASVVLCPSILLNHESLEWLAVGPRTLRVRDRQDATGATVDLEITEEGQPIACRAERPMTVGKQAVLTPWSASATEFRDREGMRTANRLEVSWHLPEGPFAYFRSEILTFEVLRQT